ncbi:MAG: hypothetical protein ACPGVP_04425 [Thiolinea sp.]
MMKRRYFLGIAGSLPFATPLLANSRPVTPAQAEGPFYPVTAIPLQADLVKNAQAITGEVMLLSGRVVDKLGKPQSQIKVEIWQCDGKGLYDHPRQSNTERFDPHFNGAGATLTNEQGYYSFRTLYPVPYTGRPPHIHAKLWRGNRELLTTQIYLQGQTESNEWFDVGREHLQIKPESNADNVQAARFEFVV